MAIKNRFSTVQRGGVLFTGNTLGLAGYLSTVTPLPPNSGLLPGPQAVDSIGAFITTNTSLQAPGGWPLGTTNNYSENSSSAVLTIPAGSTVLYAELIWAGVIVTQNQNFLGNANDPITFITPSGTNSITPDPLTASTFVVGGTGNTGYVRSKNVTSLVQQSGTYTVGNVPGALGNSVNTVPPYGAGQNFTPQNCLGWVLEVAYTNPTFPVRNMVLWVNDTLINASSPPFDINISGLATPTTGAVFGKLFLASVEGDASITGDQAAFGPTIANLTTLGNPVLSPNPNPGTSPNNPQNNFFGSQINGDNGLLDTLGTFGTQNQDAFLATNYAAARQGMDITAVDVSQTLLNNQNSAVIRLSTVGDSYANIGVGVQINAYEPLFAPLKVVSKGTANIGEIITYTITFTNISIVPANNLVFTDIVPTGAQFVPGTVIVDGNPNITADPGVGINVGTVNPNQTVTVSFNALILSLPPTPPTPPQLVNKAKIDYTFEAVSGVTLTGTNSSNDAITEVIQPVINSNKSVDKAYADLGETLTYTVTLNNPGPIAVSNVLFADIVPMGTTYVPGSLNVNTAYTGVDPASGITITSISAGQTVTITWQVLVGNTMPNPNPVLNFGTVTIPGNQPTNTNTVSTQINHGSLNITKAVDKTSAIVGNSVTYTLNVTNTGNVVANPVKLTDVVPNGTVFVGGTLTVDGNPALGDPNTGIQIGPIAVGQTKVVKFSILINNVPNPNPMSNTGTVDFSYLVDPLGTPVIAPPVTSNPVQTSVGVAQVTKAVDKAYADLGDIITYTVTLNNTGVAAVNNVTLHDDPPSGTTYVGGSLSVTSANPAGITYTGTDPASGLLFAAVTPGQVVTVIWQVKVDNVIPNPNPIPNSAYLTAAGLNPIFTNTVTTQVNHAILDVVKKVDKTTAIVGENVKYTLNVTNTGSADAVNVTLTDIVPNGTVYNTGSLVIDGNPSGDDPGTGINLSTITVGQTKVVEFTVKINSVPNPNPMINTATASYSYLVDPLGAPVPAPPATSNPVETAVGVDQVSKTVDKKFANLGEVITYTVTLNNTGVAPVTNVVMQDAVPLGTTYLGASLSVTSVNPVGITYTGTDPASGLTFASIAIGQIVTIVWQVQIGNSLPNPNPIPNKASVSAAGLNPIFTNEVTTQVNYADLQLVKSVNKQQANVGENITYTINVTNTGNVEANPVTLTDIVPSGTSYVGGTLTIDGLPSGDNPNTGVNLTSIAPGQTKIVVFSVKINTLPVPNPMVNIGKVDYEYFIDPNGTPVPATSTSNPVETAVGDIRINKSVDKVFADLGDTITYTVTVNNPGIIPVNNVLFTDALPSGTGYVNGSLTVDTAYTGTDPMTGVTLTTVGAGQTVTITWKVTVGNVLPNPNPIQNIGTITVPGLTPVNTNPVNTTVNHADLISTGNLVKSVDKTTAVVGETLTYTIKVTNTGNILANPVILTDVVPNGTSYVTGTLTVDGTPNISNPNSGIGIGPVNSGQTVTVVFSVKINTMPNPNPMPNTATIDYQYLVNPTGTPTEVTGNSNTVETAVGDILVNKLVDKAFADLGDTITYTVTVNNPGVASISNVLFTDALPSGTSYVNGSLTVDTAYTGTDPMTGITLTTVGAGQTVTITWKVTVGNVLPSPNPIQNIGTVTVPGLPPVNTNPVDTTVNHADLISQGNLVKSVDKTSAVVGEIVTYTIKVTNTGNILANPVTLTDVVPNGTSYVGGTLTVDGNPNGGDPNSGIAIGPVNPGQTVTVVFSVKINTMPNPNPMPNTAKIDYQYLVNPTGTPTGVTGNSNTVETAVGDILVNKLVDKAFADLGDTITYTVTVNNPGVTPISNVLFTDALPSGTSYVGGSLTVDAPYTGTDPASGITITTVGAGQTVTITWKVTVGNVLPNPNPIQNIGTITVPGLPPIDTNPVDTTVNHADLISQGNLVKSVDKTTAVVGETVTYTIKVTNTGNILANPVTLTDVVPNGTSYVGGTLTVDGVPSGGNPNNGIIIGPVNPGQTVTVVFSVKINTMPNPNPMPNTTTIDYQYLVNPNGTPTGVTGNSNTVETAVGDILVNKLVDKAFADLGDTITYTVTVNNPGVASISNVLFTDALPSGTSYVNGSLTVDTAYTGTDPMTGITLTTVGAGQTVTITWKVTVGNVLPSPNPIQNIGTVTVPGLPPVNTNPVDTTVNHADLISRGNLVKSVDKTSAVVGETVTYTIKVTNTGNILANPVTLTDVVPNGTSYVSGTLTVDGNPNGGDPNSGIAIGPVNPGQTVTVVFSVKINTLPNPNPMPNSGVIDYQYLVNPNGTPTEVTGNSNTVETAVGDVLVNKLVDKAFADLGDTITYTVTVNNPGITPISNVLFSDAVPSGTNYVGGSLTVDAPYTGTNPASGITITTVNAGQTVTITWKVTVGNVLPNPNPVQNIGIVTVPGLPPVNTNPVNTTINHADLISQGNLVKSVDKTVATVGETVTYTIKVTNTGNILANPVTLTDVVPNGTSYKTGTLTIDGNPNGGNPNSGIAIGPVNPGQTVTVVFGVVINTLPNPNPMPNSAKIDYQYLVNPNGTPTEVTGNSNTVETAVGDIKVNKLVDKAFADLGDTITYTVTVNNPGITPVNNVLFTDALPSGTSYVNGSLTVDAPFTGINPMTGITLTSVGSGQTVTITWKVTVGNVLPNPNPVQNIGVITVPGLPPINTNSVDTTVNHADLISQGNLVKSVDKAIAAVGETVTYTIKVTNTGNVMANPVTLTDVVPNGASYVTGTLTIDGVPNGGNPNNGIAIGPVNPNQTITVIFKAKINTMPNPNPMPNTSTIDYEYLVNPNGTPTEVTGNSNTVETAVGDIKVTKVVDKAFADLGETITYTVTVNNPGVAPVSNVLFTDGVPSGTSYVNGSLSVNTAYTGTDPASGITLTSVGAGQTVTITWKVTVGNVLPNPNPVENIGIITIPGLPPVNTNPVETQINHAGLQGIKEVDKVEAAVGETVTYTITVTNTGNVIANPVTLTDVVPNGTNYVSGTLTIDGVANSDDPSAGINLISMSPLQTKVVKFNVIINKLPVPNPMINSADLQYQYLVNPNGTPIQGSTKTNEVTTAVGNVVAQKSVDKLFADLGDTVTYKVTLINSGIVAVKNVLFKDAVPQGTSYVNGSLSVDVPYAGVDPQSGVTIASINPAQTVTITWRVLVGNIIPTTNPIENIGTIEVPGTAPVNTNPVDTKINHADLQIVKAVDKIEAAVGQNVVYTITVTNTGNIVASSVTVTDLVPSATSYVNGTLKIDGVTSSDNPNTGINLGAIAVGQTKVIVFSVVINTLPNPNPMKNTALVDYEYLVNPNGAPVEVSKNSNIVETGVADVRINKLVDKAFADLGETITYAVTINNPGIVNLNSVLFTDGVPQGTSYVNGSLTVDTPYTGTSPQTGITITSIAPKQTVTITWKVVVGNVIPNPNPIENKGIITVQGAPPVTTNTVKTTVNHADLVSDGNLVKQVNKNFADLGEVITYTKTITNTGNVPANNVVLTDIVPNGASYINGTLTVDGVPNSSNPNTGINIGTINPNQSVVVVFDARVDTLPNPNPMPNSADIVYNYVVDPNKPAANGSGTSNVVETQVNHADLISSGNFVKTVDKAIADVGDVVTYTVTVKNTGNVAANGVVVTDIVPNGASYVSGTLTVNGVANISDPNNGVNIGSINSNQTVTIVFKVKINTIPNPNPMPNKASVVYNYIVNPTEPPVSVTGNTNIVTTQVNHADLVSPGNFVKAVDKEFADVGDTVTYTITAKNTGNVAANNVVITDTVPNGASYVNGTLTVNGVANASNPNNGINIGNINPNQTISIVFDAKINTIPNPNPMPNKAEVDYTYIVSSQLPPVGVNGNTNTVLTTVNHGEILPENAVKSANKSATTPGDLVTYTVTLRNTGNTAINNVTVTDVVPSGTTFQTGTVTINGIADVNANPTVGINVGTIGVNETCTVTFVVKVESDTMETLTNKATVDYSYVVNPKEPPKNQTVDTNTVSIDNLIPKLTIIKTSNVSGALVNDIIRYTLNVTNSGQVNLTNVIIKDVLTSNLQYANNLTVNGISTTGDITTGVNIGNLAIGSNKVVSFDAKVISIPASSKVINSATGSYSYTVSGTRFNGETTSNDRIVTIYNPKLTLTKVSDNNAVVVGQNFNYVINAINEGDIIINNVIIKDALPSEFKVETITVDGNVVNGDIGAGINIGNLNVGVNKTIVLSIKVLEDLKDTFKNIVNGTGTINVDPSQNPRSVNGSATDTTGVTVYNPQLSLVKTASSKYVVSGDIVTYKIVAKNTGDIALNNVIVSDILNSGLQFISGTVKINGVLNKDASIISGVNIGTLDIGASVVVTFDVKVIVNVSGDVQNISSGSYEYTLPDKKPQNGSNNSNPNVINVNIANITVDKSVDKKEASLNDILTYTVNLTNDGNLDAINVIFRDILPQEVTLIDGSFTVNGIVINNVDLAKGVNIGNIAKGKTSTIQYKVKVIDNNCNGVVVNLANVTFQYILKDGTIGTKTSESTSKSSTTVKVNISNFKQLSVDEYLAIPSQKPNMESINNITATAKIVSSYVINTIESTSKEGQILSGYKLIINGVLEQALEYTACDMEQTVHSAHYSVPFSTFIILPSTYSKGNNINVEAIVEDVYYKQINEREFFKNVTLLVVANIMKC